MNPWFMALTISAIPLDAAFLFFSITRIFALLRDSEVTRLPAAGRLPVAKPLAKAEPFGVNTVREET